MRLMPISDLHLERRGLADIPTLSDDFDVLVCAGDIWEGEPEEGLRALITLANGRPVVIVPGNRDLYAGPDDEWTLDDQTLRLQAEAQRLNTVARESVVKVLTVDSPVCEIGGVRFVGVTLWTDWEQANRWRRTKGFLSTPEFWSWSAREEALASSNGSGDFKGIRTTRGPWTPYDAIAAHAREKARLLDELAPSFRYGATVVLTHHSPIGESSDAYRLRDYPWWMPAVCGSELLPRISARHRPYVWIHGHVHAAYDDDCGGTRVVANPVEGGSFNPNLTIEI